MHGHSGLQVSVCSVSDFSGSYGIRIRAEACVSSEIDSRNASDAPAEAAVSLDRE